MATITTQEMTAKDLIPYICQCQEAVVGRLPGSINSRAGRLLSRSLRKAARAHFQSLEARFPTARILDFAKEFLALLPGDEEATRGELRAAREEIGKIIAPSIERASASLRTAIEKHVGVAYIEAATQVEDALKREFGVEEAAGPILVSEVALVNGVRDLPIPVEVIDWTRAYAATRVTAVSVSTQQQIAETIARAMTGPTRGVPQVGSAIKSKFGSFSRRRAELIANTEMNFAMSQGTLDRGVSLGSSKKQWITVGDDRVDEEICIPNENDGEVPIRATFGSGHSNPPGHPDCRCTLATTGATRASVQQGLSGVGRRSWLGAIGSGLAAAAIITPILRGPSVVPG